MKRSARIERPLNVEHEGSLVEIPAGPCRIGDDGHDVIVAWDRDGTAESVRVPASAFQALLLRHDIVFTSW